MIYLDNNATTKPFPEILPIISKCLSDNFGNPSSTSYELGKSAKAIVENARLNVSKLIDCDPEEVIFTSGGTEAIYLALLGAARAANSKEIILSSVEHPAVVEATKLIEDLFGFKSEKCYISKDGLLDNNIFKSIAPSIISIMYANNETGIINPVLELRKNLKHNTFFHVDTVQAIGKVPFSFKDSGLSAISIAGHKIYGPKGIGALILKKGSKWKEFISGGGQEKGRRGGTENVALIAGLGESAKLLHEHMKSDDFDNISKLRTRFEEILLNEIPDTILLGKDVNRLPNTTAVIVPGILGFEIVEELGRRNICISSGSACKSGTCEPSKTALGMGYSIAEAMGLIRISFGIYNKTTDIEECAKAIIQVIKTNLSRNLDKLDSLLNN